MEIKRKGLPTGGDHPRARAVKNVETGEVFSCIKEAAEAYYISSIRNISRACKTPRFTAGGYHWRYMYSEVRF